VRQLEESQHTHYLIFIERFNVRIMAAQHCLNGRGSTITPAYPDHFRRRPAQHTEIAEIRIFRHDQKALLPGIVPNLLIENLIESWRVDMIRVRINVG